MFTTVFIQKVYQTQNKPHLIKIISTENVANQQSIPRLGQKILICCHLKARNLFICWSIFYYLHRKPPFPTPIPHFSTTHTCNVWEAPETQFEARQQEPVINCELNPLEMASGEMLLRAEGRI